jgi:hypothetical protein
MITMGAGVVVAIFKVVHLSALVEVPVEGE